MPSLVQELLTGFFWSAGPTLVMTGSETVTLGNRIRVYVNTDISGSMSSCTDNLGNSYTLAADCGATEGRSTRLYVLEAEVTTAGTLTTITVTLTTNVVSMIATSAEWTGVEPITGNDCAAGTSSSPSGTTPTGDGLHEFVVADHEFILFGSPSVPTFAPPTGYTTAADRSHGPENGSYRGIRVAYLVGSDSGLKIGTLSGGNNPVWITTTLASAGLAVRPDLPPSTFSLDGVVMH